MHAWLETLDPDWKRYWIETWTQLERLQDFRVVNSTDCGHSCVVNAHGSVESWNVSAPIMSRADA